MKKEIFYLLISTSIIAYSCEGGKKMSSAPPQTATTEADRLDDDPVPILQSLFDARDRTISEENIQKLLNGKLNLPDTVRIALYQYSKTSRNRYYYNSFTDEDFLKTQQSFVDTLINSIAKSGRVKKIFLIPAIMISPNPNITSMRETAVRLQADLLLVFTISSDLYYKYRMLNKDEAKAYATTECMLMDTRTALVPFSTIVTKDFYSKKTDEDTNLDELKKRTERIAVVQTLTETGNRIVQFMQE